MDSVRCLTMKLTFSLGVVLNQRQHLRRQTCQSRSTSIKQSNASDALDKLFLSVMEPGLLKDSVNLDIRIQADKNNGTITITDSGIGMMRQDLVDCLGTMAQSGTAKFFKALKDHPFRFIGSIKRPSITTQSFSKFPREKARIMDTAVAAEVCEELFCPIPPHEELALNGVEVFMKANGSHHQLRKLDVRLRAIIGATHTREGVYMYNNHKGCDGSRLHYDGCSCILRRNKNQWKHRLRIVSTELLARRVFPA